MNIQNQLEKKIAIFNAALNVIADNGFHESPVFKIAKEAGVGAGTIYRYFENKDDLINELFKYIEKNMNNAILKDYNPDTPLREQFINIFNKFIQFLVDNPAEASFFDQYIHSPYGAALRREILYVENISEQSLPYPFFTLFTKGKKQGIIKDLPNAILFIPATAEIARFFSDIRKGLINYNEEIVQKVVEAFWDFIKR